jgi:hypothetical protein
MEPTCAALAAALNIDASAAAVVLEDSVRAMPDAPLSQLIAMAEPALQRHLGGSAWRVIAPMQGSNVVGRLRVERSLQAVQNSSFDENTVLVVDQVLLPSRQRIRFCSLAVHWRAEKRSSRCRKLWLLPRTRRNEWGLHEKWSLQSKRAHVAAACLSFAMASRKVNALPGLHFKILLGTVQCQQNTMFSSHNTHCRGYAARWNRLRARSVCCWRELAGLQCLAGGGRRGSAEGLRCCAESATNRCAEPRSTARKGDRRLCSLLL